jgi:type IV secretion system protein VirD4
MDTRLRDILALALGGLLIGGLLGALAAGVYATWATGGDAANVGFTTILAFAPSPVTLVGEPFRTAAMIGGGVALALTVGVPAIGFRREPTSHGSARWAATREMRRAGLLSSVKALKGPVFGKLGGPRSRAACLTSTRIPHSLIAAPTGAGKGVGIVTPTLLTFPGSILCLDLKGANYANTARHREVMGDRVFKFAPYDPDGRTHRFNPLDDVAAAPPRRRYTEARRLAASLVDIRGEGAQGFLDGARDIFAAAALLVIERETPTIAALHDALSQPGRANVNLLKLGREVESPEAKSVFNKFSGRDDKHLSAYLSILMDGGLGLWADPMVRDVTAATDFSIADMRSHATSIYIVIPPTDIIPLAPLVRLIFQQAVSILQRSMPELSKGEKYPVLFLLDEFVTLGRMDNLKTAITTLREFNVRVMLVVQTISSLRDLYGRDGAGTFLANCGVQVFMGPADEETPDYISKAIGDFTRNTRAKSWKGGEMATSWSERADGARLLRPEQARLLGEEQVVVLVQNMPPVLARRVTFYRDREFGRIFRSQTGPYPEPPAIGPCDPGGAGPEDGPSLDRFDEVFPGRCGDVAAAAVDVEGGCEDDIQALPGPASSGEDGQGRLAAMGQAGDDCDALLARLRAGGSGQATSDEESGAKTGPAPVAAMPARAGTGGSMRSADDGDPEAEASLAEAGAPDDALARVAKARLALADRKMSF